MLIATALPLLLALSPQTADDPLARADYLRLMDQEFSALDTNGDGIVTSAEVAAKQQSDLRAQSLQANRQLFVQIDVNGDGTLSAEEFAALAPSGQQSNGSQFMARVDTNRDGSVTLVEHRRVMLDTFDVIDADLDGVVTTSELAASQQPQPPAR